MSDLIVRGRYQIVPEGGGKAKPHTRVTNFAKKLEDGFTLTEWKLRNVLAGAAQRPDIIAATVAAVPDLTSADAATAKAAKRALGDLAEQALDAAKANVGRETGTALHTLTEYVDRGTAVEAPPAIRGDLEAYKACMDSLGARIVRMEEIVVLPAFGLAGRFDRLVQIGGETYVLDLKTGADLSYSWLSISIQLALYAEAETIYHPPQPGEHVDVPAWHEPMPAVNRDRAIVIHLPAGQAKATAYWVDLATGREGIELVRRVQAWRAIKGVAEAIIEPAEAFPGAVEVDISTGEVDTPTWTLDDLRTFTVCRVATIVEAGHGADLAARWPLDVPTLKASQAHDDDALDAILDACRVVEGIHKMPFPLVSDPRNRDQQPTITKERK